MQSLCQTVNDEFCTLQVEKRCYHVSLLSTLWKLADVVQLFGGILHFAFFVAAAVVFWYLALVLLFVRQFVLN